MCGCICLESNSTPHHRAPTPPCLERLVVARQYLHAVSYWNLAYHLNKIISENAWARQSKTISRLFQTCILKGQNDTIHAVQEWTHLPCVHPTHQFNPRHLRVNPEYRTRSKPRSTARYSPTAPHLAPTKNKTYWGWCKRSDESNISLRLLPVLFALSSFS